MVTLNQTINSQEFESSNPGILLIEYQKTWTDKGFFHLLIKRQFEFRGVLNNTMQLLSTYRSQGFPIFQAPLVLDKNDQTRYKKAPVPARLFNGFKKGTWKAEFTEGIFKETDILIEGRSSYDGTIDSNMIEKLNEKGIDTVYVCGFTTDHCVKDTMNSLIKEGFDCIMVSDCTATISKRLQTKIEKQFKTVDTKTLRDMLKNNSYAE